MIKSLTYFLLITLTLPNAIQLSRLFNYAQHYREYLALCENKENEQLKCNGLCKFSKELAQDEHNQPEKPNFPSETISFLIHAVFPSVDVYIFNSVANHKLDEPHYLNHYSLASINKQKKPPRFLI